MNNDDIRVTDAEAREWMEGLSQNEQVELKRRALERRAIELLQPKAEAPNFAGMSDAEFNRWKMNNGFGG